MISFGVKVLKGKEINEAGDERGESDYSNYPIGRTARRC
jgi:hypothetical protein